MTDDTILDRILKLLALAADSAATPSEAEAAAAAASKLMFKYQIDQARVVHASSKSRPSVESDMYGRDYVSITKSAAWERDLLSWLCYLYDCSLHTVYAKKWTYEVIGHKDNVSLVAHMHSWLVKELGRLASKAYKVNRPTNDLYSGFDHMDPFRFHVSFKRGATAAIYDRLRKQKFELESQVIPDDRALLVISSRIRDGALAHYHPYMKGWYDAKYGIDSPEGLAVKKRDEEFKVRQAAEAANPTKKTRVRRGRTYRAYQPQTSAQAYGAGRIAGETVRLTGSKELPK